MPIAYSKDLRTRIIDAWKAKEGSQRQLAERFKVSLSFVQRVLRRYRQTGECQGKPRGATLSPILSGSLLETVKALVAEQPDALLQELCGRLQERTGVKVSVPTMHRAVEGLRLRQKKNAVCQSMTKY